MEVDQVYKKFVQNDGRDEWTEIDDYMIVLDDLSQDELHRESYELLDLHKSNVPECFLDFKNSIEFGKTVITSISSILKKYNNKGRITKKETYILKYYLVLSHVGLIST